MLDIIRRNSQSWFVKLVFGIIIIVFVFWGIQAMNSSPNTVVATVGKEDISLNAYQRTAEEMIDRYHAQYPNLTSADMRAMGVYPQVLDGMMVESAVMQEAKGMGLFVTPQSLRAVLAQMPQYLGTNGKFDQNLYNKTFNQNPKAHAQEEARIEHGLLQAQMYGYLEQSVIYTEKEGRALFNFENERRQIDLLLFTMQEFLPAVTVSPEDSLAYYEKNKEKFKVPAMASLDYVVVDPNSLGKAAAAELDAKSVQDYYEANKQNFSTPEQWHARHILILAANANKGEETPEVKRAEEAIAAIETDLKAGKDFAALAKEHSQDPGSAKNGGDLGFMPKGVLVPEFESAMLALKPGQVSGVVRTQFGLHIIKLEEYKPAGEKPLPEVDAQIRAEMVKSKVFSQFAAVQPEIEDDLILGKVKLEDLAGKYKLEVKNSGLQSLQNLGPEMGLGEAVPATVMQLKPGVMLSNLLQTGDGFAVARVKEVSAEKIPEFKEVEDRINKQLKEERASALALKAAESALEEARKDGKLTEVQTLKLVKNATVGRDGSMPDPMGRVSNLGDDVYTGQVGDWLPQVYLASGAVFIARIAEIVPATDGQWDQYKSQVMQAVNARGSEVAARSFVGRSFLRLGATVNENNPYLQQVLGQQQ